MSQLDMVSKRNSLEENRFKTISEFKWCVNDGGEVEFEWKGNQYGIGHPNGRILINAMCYEKDGKYIVVSKGLGTHTINFRFWNPAELVVLDIIPAFLYNK